LGKGDIFHVSDEKFNEEVLQSGLPVLVDSWAPWCGPCLAIAPAVEALAEEYSGRMKVGRMNVDENS
jgi:thioredoxin 1